MQLNESQIVNEVTDVVMRYEAALTGNDVAVLDELFWHSPHTVRLGATENLFGYEAIQNFRKNRSGKGLERQIVKLSITTFGDSMASANLIFKRPGQPLGRQSQMWVKMPEGWQVVSAHVSLMGD